MIASNFAGTALASVPTITTANLAGADVVWIGADLGNTDAISALSSSEQSALLSFVQAGGTALLFGENDSYAPDAQAVNDSLFAPFGIHSTGTLSHTQNYSFPAPASFPLTGPFGAVSSLSSSYAGWFDTLPASSRVVANLTGNGNPVIAELPKGTLGVGSGAVWVFGDSGGQNDAGTQTGDWNTLYANILSDSVPSQTNTPEPASAGLLLLLVGALATRRTSQPRPQ